MTETSNVRGENAHPLFKYIEKNLGSRSLNGIFISI